MGGSNSGRWGGHPTAEATASYVLSMRHIRPVPNARASYVVRFDEAFPVLVTLDWTQTDFPHVTLAHRIRAGDEQGISYRVQISRSPCRFGGWRWWWQCPSTGRRVFKLFLPLGGHRFLSRQAYRLGYASQRGTALDRAQRALDKIERRLWWDECDNPCRPPGMRWRTFERLVLKWQQAGDRLDAAWLPRVEHLMNRLFSKEP